MIDPTDEARSRAKQLAHDRIDKTEQFVLLALEEDGEDSTGILSMVSAESRNFPAFMQALQTTGLKMMHSALGAMLEDQEGVTDVTAESLGASLDPSEEIEVPDFVPSDWLDKPEED